MSNFRRFSLRSLSLFGLWLSDLFWPRGIMCTRCRCDGGGAGGAGGALRQSRLSRSCGHDMERWAGCCLGNKLGVKTQPLFKTAKPRKPIKPIPYKLINLLTVSCPDDSSKEIALPNSFLNLLRGASLFRNKDFWQELRCVGFHASF